MCCIENRETLTIKCADLQLGNDNIPFVQEIKYLGIFIQSSKNFTCNFANAKVALKLNISERLIQFTRKVLGLN